MIQDVIELSKSNNNIYSFDGKVLTEEKGLYIKEGKINYKK